MENNLFKRLFGTAAPGSARTDDPDLQRPGLVDDDPSPPQGLGLDDASAAGPPGLDDDAVALGRETDRNARGMGPPDDPEHDLGFESRARGYAPGTLEQRDHRGPAVDAYAHYVSDTDNMPTRSTEAMRARLYAHAADEANRKGVILPEETPVPDWRTDPIRRIHPGDSPEDTRRIEYNRHRTGGR